MHGTWSQATIGGKRVDLYDPPSSAPARFGVLFLHSGGLETLVDKTAYTRLFDSLRLACACPHGQHSWWTDRICSAFDAKLTAERHVVYNVLPFMANRWRLAPNGVGLLGISMGGQGALRIAFKHPQLFPVVAGIASSVDCYEMYDQDEALAEMYDSKEQCRQDTATMHVPPVGYPPHIFFCVDPGDVKWYRGNDRLHEKLSALGVPHTCDLTTRAGGHSWTYFDSVADRAVQFVHAGLEQESRRLL
ncbi:MAG TPA: alpha/beta hydrolase-fold protein [Gemmataceae bacterium]|nr:alpha/beta hydrolase-fold protein [Gemmataceae bacterium]